MMKTTLKYALICLLMTLGCGFWAHAQNRWDAALDKYEQICVQCLELRKQIQSGETVSASYVYGLIGELKSLSTSLQASSENMTDEQRLRFNSLRERYLASTEEQLEKVIQEENVRLETEDNILPSHEPTKSSTSVEKTSDGKEKFRAGVVLTGAWTKGWSLGLIASFHYGKWGGYLAGMSNLKSFGTSYSCSSEGESSLGGTFWGDGSTRTSFWAVTAGPTISVSNNFDLLVGAGYGHYQLAWRDVSGDWAFVNDHSFKGVSLQFGAIGHFRMASFSASVLYLPYGRMVCPVVGAGLMF